MRRIIGVVLIALSVIPVVQTARLYYLFEGGRAAFDEETPNASPIVFGKRTIAVSDDQPHDSSGTYSEFDGHIELTLDGQPFGIPSRAEIRRGLDGFGRYHGWFDVWIFRSRESGQSSLWIGRRIQATRAASPVFEIATISEDGRVQSDTLRAWRLGFDYRHFRTTQFIRSGTWATMPLTLELGFFFPPSLIIFPIGTFVAGIMLMRRKRAVSPATPRQP